MNDYFSSIAARGAAPVALPLSDATTPVNKLAPQPDISQRFGPSPPADPVYETISDEVMTPRPTGGSLPATVTPTPPSPGSGAGYLTRLADRLTYGQFPDRPADNTGKREHPDPIALAPERNGADSSAAAMANINPLQKITAIAPDIDSPVEAGRRGGAVQPGDRMSPIDESSDLPALHRTDIVGQQEPSNIGRIAAQRLTPNIELSKAPAIRLLPVESAVPAAPAQKSEPVAQSPVLVIGKITVEIMAPARSSPVKVIQRGRPASPSATNGTPFNKPSFGLGQL